MMHYSVRHMKKNLIILSSDEMRGDCPGFMGNPDCRTPHLDRFAQKSVVFEKHFSVHGKCVPSRVSLATGRYSHSDGLRSVAEENLMPAGTPNLLRSLRHAGYETAVFGINHVWQDLFGDNSKGSGCTDYHSFTTGYFDHLANRKWKYPAPGPGSLPVIHNPDASSLTPELRTESIPFSDDSRTEQAVHYLRKVRDRTRPFYMHLNLSAPHPEYGVEEPYFSMYKREKICAFPHALPENAPLPLRRQREIRTGPKATETDFRQIQAVYYGMITKVDALLGSVLETIESEGLLENSVILFWVDHGDFAGQYGLIEKWDSCLNDCLLHVPLILSAPGLSPGKRINSLTETTDLAPTLLELLEVQPDWNPHGSSLLPVIRGEHRKEAVFADGGHETAMRKRVAPTKHRTGDKPGCYPHHGKQETYSQYPETMARAKMVRTEKWKLVIRETGGNELYDIQSDPHEMINLWGTSDLAPVVMDLQQRLIEWSLRTDPDLPHIKSVGA